MPIKVLYPSVTARLYWKSTSILSLNYPQAVPNSVVSVLASFAVIANRTRTMLPSREWIPVLPSRPYLLESTVIPMKRNSFVAYPPGANPRSLPGSRKAIKIKGTNLMWQIILVHYIYAVCRVCAATANAFHFSYTLAVGVCSNSILRHHQQPHQRFAGHSPK